MRFLCDLVNWLSNIVLQVHAALDVFLCTSSILNLCLISLDRYWLVSRVTK